MKINRSILSLFLVLFLLLSNISVAHAIPPLPSSFYGTVKVDGVNVTAGTVVTAWINGVAYASATTFTNGSNVVYRMNIPGDDTSTTETIEGGTEGQTISFHIGSLIADQTATWTGGTNVNLALTAGSYYTISGSTGISGVTLNYGDGSTTSAADGSYSFTVASNWSGTLTPSKVGYTFSPSSKAFTHVLSNQTQNFAPTIRTYTVSVARSGTADVTITSSPSGINCGNSATTCSMIVDYGTVVTLTATPASDYYRLASWAGNCTGTTCSFTVNSAKSVTANIETATFTDVPFDHPRWAYIEALWDNSLTAGCSTAPMEYCPDRTMTRAESAAFLMRGLNGASYVPPAVTGIFIGDDWSDASISWGEKWAEALYNADLTSGCGTSPLKFCPARTTTRLEGATFGEALYHNGVGYTVPPATGTIFADMTDTTIWGTKYAELAYADGLILAWSTDTVSGKPNFSPDTLLDRSWAAYIIVKAKGLTLPE